MSAASSCDCFCPTPVITEIPGSPGENGEPGAPGADGVSAFTHLAGILSIPVNVGDSVGADVFNSTWAGIGEVVFISDDVFWAHFRVTALPNSAQMTLEYLGYPGDSAFPNDISGGAIVTPSGVQPALAGPLPNTLTDNSSGAASDTIAAGAGVITITIPLTSLATGLSTLAIDLLTNYTLGYAFKLLSFDFVTTIPGTTGGASQTFNLEIGTTNVTGGVLNVTLGSTAAIGAVTSGTTITANDVGTATDFLSIEMAAGGTAFGSGSGYFVIKLVNLDTANAIASLADHINDLIAVL